MTIDEMRQEKNRQGLTYEEIAEKSGVPAPTVQKILGGFTRSPRYSTMQALEKAFSGKGRTQSPGQNDIVHNNIPLLREAQPAYDDGSGSVPYQSGSPSGAAHRYPRQGSYTVADRNALPDDRRTELIDGVIYDMSAPRIVHQMIQSRLVTAFNIYIDSKGGDCICFEPDTDVIIDDSKRTVVMPDVFIVCDRSKIHEDAIYGAPDLVVEILSPSTKKKDYSAKYHRYLEAGVREYWIIDPEERRVVVFRFDLMKNETPGREKGKEEGNPVSIYGFESVIPVGIYNGDCKIDFRSIYEKIKFMYRK